MRSNASSLNVKLKSSYDEWKKANIPDSLQDGYPWHQRQYLQTAHDFFMHLFNKETTPDYVTDDEIIRLVGALNITYNIFFDHDAYCNYFRNKSLEELSLLNAITSRFYEHYKIDGYRADNPFGLLPIANLDYAEWQKLNYFIYARHFKRPFPDEYITSTWQIVDKLMQNKDMLNQVLAYHVSSDSRSAYQNTTVAVHLLDMCIEGKHLLNDKIDSHLIYTLLKHANPGETYRVDTTLFNLKKTIFDGKSTNVSILIDYIINLPDLDERREAIKNALDPKSAVCRLYKIGSKKVNWMGTKPWIRGYHDTRIDYFAKYAEPRLRHALALLEHEVSLPDPGSVLSQAPTFFQQDRKENRLLVNETTSLLPG